MRQVARVLTALLSIWWLASPADASVYLFTLTGPATASFELTSSPTPDSTSGIDTNGSFAINSVNGIYNGSPTTFSFIRFMTSGQQEGGLIAGGTALNLIGPQLFTGSISSPTFTLGTFGLFDGSYPLPNRYTLTVTDGPVPEAATWAMMLVGFAGIGLALRRDKRATRRSHRLC